MPALDSLQNSLGSPGHTARVGHREIDLVDRVGAGEIAGDGVGDKNRLIDNFRLPKGRYPLPEDADDHEGHTGNGQCLAYSLLRAAELGQREPLRDQGRVAVGDRVLLIEKASRDQVKPAYVGILRVYPQDQDV